MTFGSLFSGIGGMDLGLERAGMKCAWQVESDRYALQVLEKHWPDVPRYRDVRYFLGGKRWRQARLAWEVDLICGGFPCQDISNAGKRAGIDGSRSGLWSEFARIVRLLRPSYVLVENVPALTVRGLERVLGDLANLGFDAEWDRIPAAAVGAPHRRWRLFIVAHANDSGLAIRKGIGSDTLQKLQAAERGRSGHVPHADSLGVRLSGRGKVNGAEEEVPGQVPQQRLRPESFSAYGSDVHEGRWAGRRWRKRFQACCEETRRLFWPNAVAPVCGVADGVASRVDRLRGLGNAVVPQIAEWIGRRILESES